MFCNRSFLISICWLVAKCNFWLLRGFLAEYPASGQLLGWSIPCFLLLQRAETDARMFCRCRLQLNKWGWCFRPWCYLINEVKPCSRKGVCDTDVGMGFGLGPVPMHQYIPIAECCWKTNPRGGGSPREGQQIVNTLQKWVFSEV